MSNKLLMIIYLGCFIFITTATVAQSVDVFKQSSDLIDPYRDGLLLDYEGLLSQKAELNRILRTIESGDGLTDENSLAYHCLSYNLFNLSKILENYPLQSIKQLPQLFDEEFIVDKVAYTLRSLESILTEKYKHGAIHFLLSNGTLSSPPLPLHDIIKSDQVYLDGVLKSVLNNRLYAYVNLPKQEVNLSSIFEQYAEDFGGIDRIMSLIESYNTINLEEYSIKFDAYDWSLNDTNIENVKRYAPTLLLTKGGVEFKLHENYYTHVEPIQGQSATTRSSFLNHLVTMSFGTYRNLNWGIALKMRSVNVHSNRSLGSYFGGIHFISENKTSRNGVESYRRFGLTAIGPIVKYNPKFNLRGNSLIVHTLTIPVGENLEGNSLLGYLDWEGYSLFNQWLYDLDLSEKRNLFFDIGFHFENIDRRILNQEGGYVFLSTPITVIYNFYPAPRWTLYGFGNVTPRIALKNYGNLDANFEPFAHFGGGIKRFISDTVELELFITQFFSETFSRKAQTVNLGFRYSY